MCFYSCSRSDRSIIPGLMFVHLSLSIGLVVLAM